VLERVRQGYKSIALVGETVADVRNTMIEMGESSILKIAPPWETPTYEPSKRRLTFPTGAVATSFSGDEPDQLRGPQHDSAWVDELAKFKYAQETWDQLELTLRLGGNPQVLITTTPRPIPIIKAMVEDDSIVCTTGSTYENRDNLAAKFFSRVRSKYEGTRLGRQELHGEILDDNPDALWNRSDILHVAGLPDGVDLVRIVVGVDPAVTANKDSAETGIIVVGLGSDGHAYVLDDMSLRGSPASWAAEVVTAYRKHKADRIIGEVNNGGDLVEMAIRTHDRNVSYSSVRASRGKYTRAEPIAALYEQHRVFHVGQFADLEDQMCEWNPTEGVSPDRIDALVWAITELGLTNHDWHVTNATDDEEPIPETLEDAQRAVIHDESAWERL
jgi:phage terminase large subunit-like protein